MLAIESREDCGALYHTLITVTVVLSLCLGVFDANASIFTMMIVGTDIDVALFLVRHGVVLFVVVIGDGDKYKPELLQYERSNNINTIQPRGGT